MKLYIVGIGSKIQSFPYLAKLYDVLKRFGEPDYIYWDRGEGCLNENYSGFPVYSSSPNGKISVIIGYLAWTFSLFLYFMRKSNSDGIYFCSRLDSAFPAFLATLFGKKVKYVYLDRDAYFMTYRLGIFKPIVKKLEFLVARNSLRHFIPGESRNFTKLSNVSVIHNTPNQVFFEKAKAIADEKLVPVLGSDPRFKIFINGWVVQTRGASMIIDVVSRLNSKDFLVILAGPSDCSNVKKLSSLSCVSYLGQLSNTECLSYYFVADVTFAFYDPSIEINKKAEPNKWYDCLYTGCLIVTNKGIDTLSYIPKNSYCTVDYNDSNSLYSLLHKLSINKNSVGAFGERTKANRDLNLDFWDVKVSGVVTSLLEDK